MPTQTTKLGLPKPLGNENFTRAKYNELIDAIDSKAGAANGLAQLGADGKVPASQLDVSAPQDASTTQKGVVQLSNATNSTSEVLAATPKAVKAVDDKIGILSGLNTTAKDNLVNAVNELFTFANDGKTKWSSVIGSPLASSDTFTQMQSKTQTIKNTLATNLTAKGQSSVGTETLTVLVNKVANIEVGAKWATGTQILSSTNVLLVTGLNFEAKVIVLVAKSNSSSNTYYAVYSKDDPYSLNYISQANTYTTSNATRSSVSNITIDGSGFSFPFASSNVTVKWWAYE